MARRELPDISHISQPSGHLSKGWEQCKPIDITMVTPMLGGGVATGEIDLVTPISGKSIRGHLRFWWRILKGVHLPAVSSPPTVEAIALREREIFGQADSPSGIEIEVIQPQWNQLRRHANNYGFHPYGPEAYALFSAKQSKNDLLKEGVSFTLNMRYATETKLNFWREQENRDRQKKSLAPLPSIVEPIEAELKIALWGWLNFGGIGARTRRGLGALFSPDYEIKSKVATLADMSTLNIYAGKPIGQDAASALTAWQDSLKVYRSFRQWRRGSQNRGSSYWPEPDSIRQATNCHDPHHSPKNLSSFYPRAVLGLPIIFSFKDSPKDRQGNKLPPNKTKDPYDSELRPEVTDENGKLIVGTRMASPIITRPLCIDGRWASAIVVLPHDHIYRLTARLQGKGVDQSGSETTIDRHIPQSQISGSGLFGISTMQGQTNAIAALIDLSGFNRVNLE